MKQHSEDQANSQENRNEQKGNNANSNQSREKKNVVPQDTHNESTDSGGSMSEGNLSNSRYGRERTQSLHDKTTVMGSDTDGQAN